MSEASVSDVVSSYDSFKMNGKEYYQGILLNTTNYSNDRISRIDFNVENVSEISFDIAHLDGGKEGNATVSVYLDDVLAEKIELTPSMATKRYVLDVSTAKSVRFSVLRKSGAAYAFADFDFVPATAGVLGDANGDGLVTIADAVMLQKWLLAKSKELTYWENVDLCKDNKIDVFDLCLLKRMLIEK